MMMEGAEWSSFNGANSVNEEASFMAQLFPDYPLDSNDIETSNAALSSSCYSGMTRDDNGSYLSNDDNNNSNFYCLSQGSSDYSSSSGSMSLPFHGTYSLNDAYEFFPVEYCPTVSKHFVQHFPGSLPMERNEQLSLEMSSGGSYEDQPSEFLADKNQQLKQECDQMSEVDPTAEDRRSADDLLENGRKRSRVSEKGKRNIKAKNQKNGSDDDEENNGHPELSRQNSVNCSEEVCNESQEISGVTSSSLNSKGNAAVNANGKARANRGAATDPQSLYARKRRERINERLKILQNLVPNGTKVDISTMLEEAVHYVKFLQLQIKLLSSDELWMYAPLAYNGVDIGLDPKIKALL